MQRIILKAVLLLAVVLIFGCVSVNVQTTDKIVTDDYDSVSDIIAGTVPAEFEFRDIRGMTLEKSREIIDWLSPPLHAGAGLQPSIGGSIPHLSCGWVRDCRPIKNWPVGRIYVLGEYPHSLAVNYLYENNRFYFPVHKKVNEQVCRLIQKNDNVFFSVDNYALNVWYSVHVFGKSRILELDQMPEKWISKLELTFGKECFNYSTKDGTNEVIVEITPELITAKALDMPGWYLGKVNYTNGKPIPIVAKPESKVGTTQFAKGVKFIGLPAVTADHILRQSHSGRINTLDNGNPYSVPLSYGYVNGKIIFHSKKNGQKIINIKCNSKVSFDVEWIWDRQDWYTVTIEGQARILQAKEGFSAMQYFSKFLETRDGVIPSDYAPKLGENLGPERMMQTITVIEVMPETVITRKAIINKEWYNRLPDIFKK